MSCGLTPEQLDKIRADWKAAQREPVRVLESYELDPRRCLHCLDDGMVCEDHPEFPAHMTVEGHADHGAPGMPCPACCSPVPEDGTHSIGEAFTPDWRRTP